MTSDTSHGIKERSHRGENFEQFYNDLWKRKVHWNCE